MVVLMASYHKRYSLVVLAQYYSLFHVKIFHFLRDVFVVVLMVCCYKGYLFDVLGWHHSFFLVKIFHFLTDDLVVVGSPHFGL